MNVKDIVENLPTLHQKLAVTALGLMALYLIARQVRNNYYHERHALPWFFGIMVGIFAIWCDLFLVFVTRAIGANVPASALLLLLLFFLFLVCAWLTSLVSRQQRTIARLIITVSILKSRLDAVDLHNSRGNSGD